MVMVYLIFALSIFFVRLFAGYDSRYQKGKYISIKNTVLSAVLLDGMSIYGRTRRLKKDKNKMSFCGFPFYLGIGIVLLTNIVFLIIPDIPMSVIARKVITLFTGTFHTVKQLTLARGSEVVVLPSGQAAKEPLEVDGEVVGRVPAKFKVLEDQLNVMVP